LAHILILQEIFKSIIIMKINRYILTIFLTLNFNTCLRLDDFLFNQQKIQSYKLDNYTGDRELANLPASYDIASNLIYGPFTITSKSEKNQNVTIYAIYIGDPALIANGIQKVILYCHGNRDHMDFYWPRAKLLANVGAKNKYGVLMIDYQGYGMSDGNPTEAGMYNDVQAAIGWLSNQGLTANNLIIYGYSLGSAPATELTAHPRTIQPSLIMLEAPFASAETMAQDATLLALPGSYFMNIKINNAENMRLIDKPFLWMHGINDSFLSITTHGEVVYANYAGISSLAIRVSGAVHNNLPEVYGYNNYTLVLDQFILTNLP